MNFGGAEVVYDYAESGIIIVPVPYDETSTWIKGSDRAPDAILEASVNLEFYDVETATEVHKKGIHTIQPVTERKSPVLIGGNHTISIGSVKAFSEHFSDLTVLQLDAHSDLRQEYEGSKYNHACSMARARELAPIVQVGIRSMSVDELPFADPDRIFYAHDLYYDKQLYASAIQKLSDNVYITVDLDVFDPSIMPSTGTPEPGGPHYYELMHFLREVAKSKNVVGFDVVELCPSSTNKSPDFIAAKVIYQLLSYIFCPPTPPDSRSGPALKGAKS
jgi:agmatinase